MKIQEVAPRIDPKRVLYLQEKFLEHTEELETLNAEQQLQAKKEFLALERIGSDLSVGDAKDPENKPKNRYPDVLRKSAGALGERILLHCIVTS